MFFISPLRTANIGCHVRQRFCVSVSHTTTHRSPCCGRPAFQCRVYRVSRQFSSSTTSSSGLNSEAQKSAYEYYRSKRNNESFVYKLRSMLGIGGDHRQRIRKAAAPQQRMSLRDRNVQLAWYATALVVGGVGATYAAVPLYKVFCQATGFGGTTQRVRIKSSSAEADTAAEVVIYSIEGIVSILSNFVQNVWDLIPSPRIGGKGTRVHTWTDEEAAEKLANLKPVTNADLLTVYFDTTIGNVLPWTFEPVQSDVKVVPGETALSFFRVTNHSPDKAITGVATYHVEPPKVGLYFQKIQCFCFEEQRLLPGETVDMPLFFFIDPEIMNDPQVSYVRNITLGYTFFKTDEDEDDDEDEDEDED